MHKPHLRIYSPYSFLLHMFAWSWQLDSRFRTNDPIQIILCPMEWNLWLMILIGNVWVSFMNLFPLLFLSLLGWSCRLQQWCFLDSRFTLNRTCRASDESNRMCVQTPSCHKVEWTRTFRSLMYNGQWVRTFRTNDRIQIILCPMEWNLWLKILIGNVWVSFMNLFPLLFLSLLSWSCRLQQWCFLDSRFTLNRTCKASDKSNRMCVQSRAVTK